MFIYRRIKILIWLIKSSSPFREITVVDHRVKKRQSESKTTLKNDRRLAVSELLSLFGNIARPAHEMHESRAVARGCALGARYKRASIKATLRVSSFLL